jgi:hypothetical protein
MEKRESQHVRALVAAAAAIGTIKEYERPKRAKGTRREEEKREWLVRFINMSPRADYYRRRPTSNCRLPCWTFFCSFFTFSRTNLNTFSLLLVQFFSHIKMKEKSASAGRNDSTLIQDMTSNLEQGKEFLLLQMSHLSRNSGELSFWSVTVMTTRVVELSGG